jgi:hypothetical protein
VMEKYLVRAPGELSDDNMLWCRENV